MGSNLSIGDMVRKIAELVGGCDLNDWETGFVKDIAAFVEKNGTVSLTGKQVQVIQRIYYENF